MRERLDEMIKNSPDGTIVLTPEDEHARVLDLLKRSHAVLMGLLQSDMHQAVAKSLNQHGLDLASVYRILNADDFEVVDKKLISPNYPENHGG